MHPGTKRGHLKRKNNGIETWWPFAPYDPIVRYRCRGGRGRIRTCTYLGYAVKELQGTEFLVAHATSKKKLQFFVPECLNQFSAIERAGPEN
jgi:hypothetical protein